MIICLIVFHSLIESKIELKSNQFILPLPPKIKKMKTDIEIARSIELTKIKQIARETGIPVEHISNYGRYIA